MKKNKELANLYYDVALECKEKYYSNIDTSLLDEYLKNETEIQKMIRKAFEEFEKDNNYRNMIDFIKETKKESINDIKKYLSSSSGLALLGNSIDITIQEITEIANIWNIRYTTEEMEDKTLYNLVISEYGSEYKTHLDTFKKLEKLDTLLFDEFKKFKNEYN